MQNNNASTQKLLLPLGISLYTFQSTGYLAGVFWGKIDAQRNLGKFALFVSFFPQIIQRPISMYDQLAHQLYAPHDFDITRLKHGAELILWGLFRKLVFANRAVIALNAITEDSGREAVPSSLQPAAGLHSCNTVFRRLRSVLWRSGFRICAVLGNL